MSKPQLQATRYSDVVSSVVSAGGELVSIHFHLYTGRVVARAEAGAPGAYHSGIVLGADKYGRFWIAHHHRLHGKPVMQPAEDFCEEGTLLFDLRNVAFSGLEVAARAAWQVTEGKAWCESTYGSEDFVNLCVCAKLPVTTGIPKNYALWLGLFSAFLRVIE